MILSKIIQDSANEILGIPLPRTLVNKQEEGPRLLRAPAPACQRLRSDRYARITNVNIFLPPPKSRS